MNFPRQQCCDGLLWIIVCSTLVAGGCKLASRMPKSAWPVDVATQPQVPSKVAAIWSDTVMYTPGKPPTRGFGGRLYFYDDRSDAVKVDGKLVVYVYDDDNPSPDDRPARRYIFTSEQLANHYAGSELGPSYSVWIPWDEIGGPTKQLSLVPFFLPSEGGLVAGEHARHRLPGSSNLPTAGTTQEDGPAPRRLKPSSGVRQVTYEEPLPQRSVEPVRPSQETLRTTTINIPSVTQQRLAASQNVPRDQRMYVAARNEDATDSRWDYYDRAKFAAERAAEYRSERFTRQRSAPWERRAEPTPAPAAPSTESRPESAVESASHWAEQYRQQRRQPQRAEPPVPAAAPPTQSTTHSGYSPRPARTSPVGQSTDGRARSPLSPAGWPFGLPALPAPAGGSPASATLPTSVRYGY